MPLPYFIDWGSSNKLLGYLFWTGLFLGVGGVFIELCSLFMYHLELSIRGGGIT